MVKSEIVRKYELMLIISAKLTPDEKESVFKQIVETVNKAGAKIINNQVFLERHKMPFKIKRNNEATYYLVNFESKSSAILEMKQLLKLNEKILRFIVLTSDK